VLPAAARPRLSLSELTAGLDPWLDGTGVDDNALPVAQKKADKAHKEVEDARLKLAAERQQAQVIA
jgi:hypothetical protein